LTIFINIVNENKKYCKYLQKLLQLKNECDTIILERLGEKNEKIK